MQENLFHTGEKSASKCSLKLEEYKPHLWAWHYYVTEAFKACKMAALLKNGFHQQWTQWSEQIFLTVLTSKGLLLSTKTACQGEAVHVTPN